VVVPCDVAGSVMTLLPLRTWSGSHVTRCPLLTRVPGLTGLVSPAVLRPLYIRNSKLAIYF
jgi:hypothetical protein